MPFCFQASEHHQLNLFAAAKFLSFFSTKQILHNTFVLKLLEFLMEQK